MCKVFPSCQLVDITQTSATEFCKTLQALVCVEMSAKFFFFNALTYMFIDRRKKKLLALKDHVV